LRIYFLNVTFANNGRWGDYQTSERPIFGRANAAPIGTGIMTAFRALANPASNFSPNADISRSNFSVVIFA
jgi:hypothetical protein